MKGRRFTVKQVTEILRQADAAAELARRSGTSVQHVCCSKEYIGREVEQENQLRQLENNRLKQLVADLTLDKAMLQDVLVRILESRHASANYHDAASIPYRGLKRANVGNSGLEKDHETTKPN